MSNLSKIRDSRFWALWRASGTVEGTAAAEARAQATKELVKACVEMVTTRRDDGGSTTRSGAD